MTSSCDGRVAIVNPFFDEKIFFARIGENDFRAALRAKSKTRAVLTLTPGRD